jgi:hypothetical protein
MTFRLIIQRLHIIFCLSLLACLSQAQDVSRFTIQFDSDSDILKDSAILKLDSVFKKLRNIPEAYMIHLSGHTDSVGDVDYNARLSQKRITSTQAYFLSKGFSKENITIEAKGLSAPISDNATETGKALNRRVEIRIRLNLPELNKIGAFRLEPTSYSYQSLQRDTFGYKSGSRFIIPEQAFAYQNGKPYNGDVRITYIEYRDPIDFLLSGIPMNHTEDKTSYIFNSGGMFQMRAYGDNNEELILAPGKEVEVNFQLTDSVPNMNFYKLQDFNRRWKELSEIPFWRNQHVFDGKDITDRRIKSICEYTNCEQLKYLSTSGLEYCQSASEEYVLANNKDTLFDSRDSVWRDVLEWNDKIIQLKAIRDSFINEISEDYHFNVKVNEDKVSFELSVVNAAGASLPIFEKLSWKLTEKDEGLPERLSQKSFVFMGVKAMSKKGMFRVRFSNERSQGAMAIEGLKMWSKEKVDKSVFEKTQTQILACADSIVQVQKRRESSRDSLSRLIEQYGKKVTEFSKLSQCFWSINRPFMSEAEKSMNLGEWVYYFNEHSSEFKQRYEDIGVSKNFKQCFNEMNSYERNAYLISKNNQLLRSLDDSSSLSLPLKISSMGIFNCDQLARIEKPLTISASYTNPAGNPLKIIVTNVVDEKLNSILRYDGYSGYGPSTFALSSVNRSMLIVMDYKGQLYTVDHKQTQAVLGLKEGSKPTLSFICTPIGPDRKKESLLSSL